MSISLDKKKGIDLKKGSKVSLEKEGRRLEEVCVGLNWGAIKKGIFFNLIKQTIAVDLDGSVTTYDENKQIVETVYYRKLRSKDGAIVHSGDDRDGDIYGDDELDNEVIEIDLRKVNPRVKYIVFYLTSYEGRDFASIPYSKIRIFEGNSKRVDSVFATFNLSADESFKGSTAMVLGKLTRKEDGNWEFSTIGEAVPTKTIDETILYIQKHYLN